MALAHVLYCTVPPGTYHTKYVHVPGVGNRGVGSVTLRMTAVITTDWAAPVFGSRTGTGTAGAAGLEDVVFRLWFWQVGKLWAGNFDVTR